MTDRLDLLLLGATGFTGMHCIPYILKFSEIDGRSLTWGVAGRSEDKLKEVLVKMGQREGVDLSAIPIIPCDITNTESLLKMAQKTKIVINTCGPYRELGEPVIKACIEAGAHHVDISGDLEFMERMELEQNEAAKKKGVYIVSACGFDSIPCDLGIIYLQKEFDGVLNSVVTYLEAWEEGGMTSGSVLNSGTWGSVVDGLHTQRKLKKIRKKLYPEKMPAFKPKLKSHIIPHKPKAVTGWSLPFPGSDIAVARRTQRYFYENESERPIQIDTQFVVKSFYYVLMFMFYGALFGMFAFFSSGRKLLLKYPSFFSRGMFTKEPPTEEKIDKFWAQLTLYGEGWSEELSNPIEHSVPPNKVIIGKVKGRNPGYGATCACLVGSAIMIATEKDKLPNNGKGGVYTPGVAFAKTSLINLLNKNGLTFEIISETKSNM